MNEEHSLTRRWGVDGAWQPSLLSAIAHAAPMSRKGCAPSLIILPPSLRDLTTDNTGQRNALALLLCISDYHHHLLVLIRYWRYVLRGLCFAASATVVRGGSQFSSDAVCAMSSCGATHMHELCILELLVVMLHGQVERRLQCGASKGCVLISATAAVQQLRMEEAEADGSSGAIAWERGEAESRSRGGGEDGDDPQLLVVASTQPGDEERRERAATSGSGRGRG